MGNRTAALVLAAAVGLVCCSLAVTGLWRMQTGLLEVRHESGKKWEPSLGFFVRRKSAPHNARSESDSAIAHQEAVRLAGRLSGESPAQQKRFMKAFNKEAEAAGAPARLEEHAVAAMLAKHQKAQKERRHMLRQARQIPDHYKHTWTKSPNFNLRGYWPLIGEMTKCVVTLQQCNVSNKPGVVSQKTEVPQYGSRAACPT
jgi:hypothetical protein